MNEIDLKSTTKLPKTQIRSNDDTILLQICYCFQISDSENSVNDRHFFGL